MKKVVKLVCEVVSYVQYDDEERDLEDVIAGMPVYDEVNLGYSYADTYFSGWDAVDDRDL